MYHEVGEGEVARQLLAVIRVCEVFLRNFHFAYVRHHEVPTVWHPEVQLQAAIH